MNNQHFEIEILGKSIPVKIVHGRGKRISMQVRDAVVSLHLPKGRYTSIPDYAMEHLRNWLTKLLTTKPTIFDVPEQRFHHGSTLDIMGKPYTLQLHPGTREKVIQGKKNETTIDIFIPSSVIDKRDLLKEVLPKLLGKMFLKEMDARVRHLNAITVQGALGKVSIRHVVSRYGSCTGNNDIMIAARMLLAPLDILDHLIIHELAHLKHKDHSKRFWAEVARHDVDFKRHNKWLKENANQLKF